MAKLKSGPILNPAITKEFLKYKNFSNSFIKEFGKKNPEAQVAILNDEQLWHELFNWLFNKSDASKNIELNLPASPIKLYGQINIEKFEDKKNVVTLTGAQNDQGISTLKFNGSFDFLFVYSQVT